ncbi:BlaI/MecI/CopY family transcriptional regulator [Parapedobacter sp.]
MIRELTKAEEEVMRIIWQRQEAMVKEVLAAMPHPKPAYNTVSTVIRVLEGKGFLDHKAYGNTYVYFPLVAETDYKHFAFDKIMNNYFGNSYKHLVSFLVEEKKLDTQTLDELLKMAGKLKK